MVMRTAANQDGKTLVLGIGNTLLRDEGVGIHVVEALRRLHPDLPNVEFLDGGTLSFTLAGPIEDCERLIVVDAADFKAPAGAVGMFMGEEIDRFLGSSRRSSVHEVGLIDLMAISHLRGHVPARRALIGIQPGSVEWGETPTATVARAVPVACEMAMALIREWPQ